MTSSVKRIIPVLLSGGSGSRLWPLSRESYPKQLLSLFGESTLLQQTLLRVADGCMFEPAQIIAAEEHRFVISEQIRAIGLKRVELILEPAGRNTAPAAAIAALRAAHTDPEALLLLLPTDHLIGDSAAFKEYVSRATIAACAGKIALFGIKPTAPATGYGYIRAKTCSAMNGGYFDVDEFIEKPNLEEAKAYLAANNCYWNSGIYLASARTFITEFERLAPDILTACRGALGGMTGDLDFLRLDPAHFLNCPAVSLDYAIAEKTNRASVVPALFDWSDVGTWSAIWNLGPKQGRGNVAFGDVEIEDSKRCYVRSEGPLVATLGVEDLVIVATQDAVLVASKKHDEDVHKIVAKLNARNHSAGRQNLKVQRPWGFFQGSTRGTAFK